MNASYPNSSRPTEEEQELGFAELVALWKKDNNDLYESKGTKPRRPAQAYVPPAKPHPEPDVELATLDETQATPLEDAKQAKRKAIIASAVYKHLTKGPSGTSITGSTIITEANGQQYVIPPGINSRPVQIQPNGHLYQSHCQYQQFGGLLDFDLFIKEVKEQAKQCFGNHGSREQAIAQARFHALEANMVAIQAEINLLNSPSIFRYSEAQVKEQPFKSLKHIHKKFLLGDPNQYTPGGAISTPQSRHSSAISTLRAKLAKVRRTFVALALDFYPHSPRSIKDAVAQARRNAEEIEQNLLKSAKDKIVAIDSQLAQAEGNSYQAMELHQKKESAEQLADEIAIEHAFALKQLGTLREAAVRAIESDQKQTLQQFGIEEGELSEAQKIRLQYAHSNKDLDFSPVVDYLRALEVRALTKRKPEHHRSKADALAEFARDVANAKDFATIQSLANRLDSNFEHSNWLHSFFSKMLTGLAKLVSKQEAPAPRSDQQCGDALRERKRVTASGSYQTAFALLEQQASKLDQTDPGCEAVYTTVPKKGCKGDANAPGAASRTDVPLHAISAVC